MTKAEILNLCDLQQSVRKRAMPAPEGKPMTKAEILNLCDLQQSVRKRAMPAPQGEGCIKVKKLLYRLLTQTLSPKGKARG